MDPDELLTQWASKIHQVPHMATHGVCHVCLGSAGTGYPTCWTCGHRWTTHPEFDGACVLIVPCTVAIQPGDWYSAMRAYKTGAANFRTRGPVLASVLWKWLMLHEQELINSLGGVPDVTATVPSRTRTPPTPLRRVVNWAVANSLGQGVHIDDVVRFTSGHQQKQRDSLFPEQLNATLPVAGKRILLIEDTWVTGATALSSALALRRAGAQAVALVSIARMVYSDGMSSEYATSAVSPADLALWPR